MNLFLTGEFKQCKTGKRVLEDYLKNYNQFNQGLILDLFAIACCQQMTNDFRPMMTRAYLTKGF